MHDLTYICIGKIKYLCVKECVMNTEQKKVKKKTEQKKTVKSRKEIVDSPEIRPVGVREKSLT